MLKLTAQDFHEPVSVRLASTAAFVGLIHL
jgi:hypothetical protein